MNYNYYDNLNNMNSNMNNYMNNNVNTNSSYNNLNLYDPLEGYMRGNLFRDLYEPYKNYRPQKVKINNEKEELLMGIGEYSFAMHELNLYLDNYPNDQNALNLFNKYREQANELVQKYERKYGPLDVKGENNTNVPFIWSTSNWPWEG